MTCRIYIDELRKPALAEAYCDRVYAKAVAVKQRPAGDVAAAKPIGSADAKPPGSIYLQLIQVGFVPSWLQMRAAIAWTAGTTPT